MLPDTQIRRKNREIVGSLAKKKSFLHRLDVNPAEVLIKSVLTMP